MSGTFVLPAAGAAVGLLGAAAVWLRSRVLLVAVDGPSMRPSLDDGERVLVRRARMEALRAGQVVVIRRPPPWRTLDSWHGGELVEEAGWPPGTPPPPARLMIKRVVAVAGDSLPALMAGADAHLGATVPAGRFLVVGDNLRHSHDSRRFGYLDANDLVGITIWRH